MSADLARDDLCEALRELEASAHQLGHLLTRTRIAAELGWASAPQRLCEAQALAARIAGELDLGGGA